MKKCAVLVVDDDKSARTYISRLLSPERYAVECTASGEVAMARIDSPTPPSIMLLDVLMPVVGGLDVLARMAKCGKRVPTIVVSGVDQTATVVKAMKLGASDYLVKPFEEEDLETAIRNALQISRAVREGVPGDAFRSASAEMGRIRELAQRVADVDVPVLILGESGVGKEVLARYVHWVSRRRERPIVKVNCAALPADLLESELFGYEQGAFTGALREKAGKFELADQGTILLDEIGEMSPALQAKLLHVLQDGEYAPLGSNRTIRVDARVMATTNKRLDVAVASGEFRLDLFHRLNVIRFDIPPLRERREDIPGLCEAFVTRYQEAYGRPKVPLPPAVIEAFLRYDWPGNVRQLENAVKRLVVLGDSEFVLADLRAPALQGPGAPRPQAVSLKRFAATAAEEAERAVILRLLEQRNWNRKQVARELGICYKSLLNRLIRWQLSGRGRRPPAGSQ